MVHIILNFVPFGHGFVHKVLRYKVLTIYLKLDFHKTMSA